MESYIKKHIVYDLGFLILKSLTKMNHNIGQKEMEFK